MIGKIKQLRKLIDVSITEAKAILQENDLDVEKSFLIIQQKQLKPIIKATGSSLEQAQKAYEQSDRDIDRAIEKIKFNQNPQAFYKKHKPRLTNIGMNYSGIKFFIEKCRAYESEEIRWCDEESFQGENMEGASPGGNINPYGYYVIGTTSGGNGIVVSNEDPRICYAGHTWYDEDSIYYEDIAGANKEWKELPLSGENVKKSLFTLAKNQEEFIQLLKDGSIDETLDEID